MAVQESILKLVRLDIENFLRVQALSIAADGKHVVISGQNGAGKTSAIDSIWAALGGKPGTSMPEPIHQGAERAKVKLDLGEYLVEKVWTEKSSRLVVTAQDGSKVREPAELLKGLLGKYSLDPVAFLQRRPQDQVDDVLAIGGAQPPVGEVMSITGDAHDPKPGESAEAYLMRLSGDETGLYFVRRRELHRTLDQKRAALEEQRQVLEQLGGPPSPEEQEASASELLKQLKALNQQADRRRAVQDTAAANQRELSENQTKLNGLQEQLRQKEAEAGQIIADIEKLRTRLEDVKRQCAEAAGRIARGEAYVAELAAEAQASQEAVAALPDPAPQIAALTRQIDGVEQTNKKHARRRMAAERLESLARDVQRAELEHRAQDAILEKLRALRANLLDGLDLGVPGLQVGAGELRLNGVPFRQASQAEQLRVAAAIAMRQNPRLKLLRLDEGERLDQNSREMLFQMASDKGWQVVMTAVANTDGLKVEIMDKEIP